jgi:hypothetical protein
MCSVRQLITFRKVTLDSNLLVLTQESKRNNKNLLQEGQLNQAIILTILAATKIRQTLESLIDKVKATPTL